MEPAQIPQATERRSPTDRRRHVRTEGILDDGSDYTLEEREFMFAMEAWKRHHRKPFPRWSEVLEVLKSLGYRKG